MTAFDLRLTKYSFGYVQILYLPESGGKLNQKRPRDSRIWTPRASSLPHALLRRATNKYSDFVTFVAMIVNYIVTLFMVRADDWYPRMARGVIRINAAYVTNVALKWNFKFTA